MLSAFRAVGRVAQAGWRDQRAVAAVEFAFILPAMLAFYVGSVDLTRSVLASRKVALVSRTIADLVAQQPSAVSTPTTKIATIFAASSAIMQPFQTTGMTLTVSALTIKAKSNGTCCDVTVDWSYTQSGTLRPCNTPLLQVVAGTKPAANNISQNLVTANTQAGYTYSATKVSYVIVADVNYSYTPFFSQATAWFTGGFQKTSYMVPRSASGQVTLTNATSAGTGQSGQICS